MIEISEENGTPLVYVLVAVVDVDRKRRAEERMAKMRASRGTRPTTNTERDMATTTTATQQQQQQKTQHNRPPAQFQQTQTPQDAQ